MTKKLRLIILPIAILTTVLAYGQIGPKFQAGIRGGANFANFRALQSSAIQTHTSNTFIMVGAFAQVRILKKFGLRAEILSNPKGALVNYFDGNNIKVEAIRKLNYADATFSVMYNFKVLRYLGLYAFGGYGYESLLSVKDAIQKPYTDTKTLTENFSEDAHSALLGFGIRMHISNINITPEIRYLHGLTDVVKTNVETKNQVITASLGISLTL